MGPPAGEEPSTAEDFGPVEACTGFCLLCDYGSTPGEETGDNINADIKALECVVCSVRKSMGIKRASEAIHSYYAENLRDKQPFCNDDEWTVDVIEDHLCRHAAPEAVARGERPGEDMVGLQSPSSNYYDWIVTHIHTP